MDKFELFGALLAIIGIGVLSLKAFGRRQFRGFPYIIMCSSVCIPYFLHGAVCKERRPRTVNGGSNGSCNSARFIVVIFKGETNFMANVEGVSAVLDWVYSYYACIFTADSRSKISQAKQRRQSFYRQRHSGEWFSPSLF